MVKFKSKLPSMIIACLMALVIMVSAVTPAFAAGTASVGSVAGDVDGGTIVGQDVDQGKQTVYDEFDVTGNMTSNADVYVTVPESDIMVTVPKVVILDGKSGASNVGEYTVKVQGDIAAETVIKVVPQDEMDDRDGVNFEMSSAGKDNIPTDVEQAKTEFTYADGVRANAAASTTGTVTAYGMTAGQWNGDFQFNISAGKKENGSSSDIAYDGKTYEEIFVDLNVMLNGGFEYEEPFNVNSGDPTKTNAISNSGNYSLNVSGTTSQQLLQPVSALAEGDYYIAFKSQISRYEKGEVGVYINSGSNTYKVVTTETTGNEFVTTSGIVNVPSKLYGNIFYGSLSSANLDGYLDDIVVIPLSLFSTEPTKDELDALYETFLTLPNNKEYSDSEYKDAFIEAANKKAAELGMTNSHFSVASGATSVDSYSTSRDMMKLFVEAYTYDELGPIWSSKTKNIHIFGLNDAAGDYTINSTIPDTTIGGQYQILGGKTGTWTDTSKTTYNLGIVAEVEGKTVVGIVMSALDGDKRFDAMDELFDICANIISDSSYDASSDSVTNAQSAIACVINDDGSYEVLFEQDADTKHNPASLTKVLTAITGLDYITDLQKVITFKQIDMCEAGAKYFKVGNSITIEDLLYDMMLPSANQAAEAFARHVGEIILK